LSQKLRRAFREAGYRLRVRTMTPRVTRSRRY
jgi:hypothetical protein